MLSKDTGVRGPHGFLYLPHILFISINYTNCLKFIPSSVPVIQFSSVAQSRPTLRSHELQHSRPSCPSPTPAASPNLCPLSQWCHLTISSSVIPPLLLLPSIFPSIRVSSNESALRIRWPKYWSFSFNISPVNTQDWSPLGWTGWISLQSKGLSRVFSNITIQKHQFFGTQLSL